jgi:tetratricopeptide (TPR) repeat protein
LDNLHIAFERVADRAPETALRAALSMIPMLDAVGPKRLLRSVLDGGVAIAVESKGLDGLHTDLLLWRARHHRRMGDAKLASADADRAIELAEAANDTSRLILALVEKAMMLAESGEPAEATLVAGQALEMARACDDLNALGAAVNAMAYATGFAGELDECHALNLEQMEIWRTLGNLRQEANTLLSLAVDHGNRGEIEAAEPLLRKALTLHRRVGTRRGEAMCQANLVLVAIQRGNLDEARRRAGKAIEIQRALGNRMPIGAIHCNIGCIDLLQGEHEAALDHFREGDRLMTEVGHHFYASFIRRDRAIAAMVTDRLEEAEAAARGAVTAAEAMPKQTLKPTADTVLAAVVAARGSLAEADTLLHGAGVIQKEVGGPADLAMVALGEAFRDLALARQIEGDDPDGARELIEAATDVATRHGYPLEDWTPDLTYDTTLQIFKVALDVTIARLPGV